jgi:pimeloyl-ACP methyl ester carboxylesterase
MSTPIRTLVNIGTHSLALYAHGPEPSSYKDPVVLFVSGIASSSLVWAGVIRCLPPTLRSYTYDRSDCGASEASPLAPTAENIALELSHLIKAASITNPLILVGHSWAGVLIREFIALTGNGPHIAGAVFVDANQEKSLQVLNVLDPNLGAMFAGLDYLSGMGLAAEHKLTQDEWDAYMRDEATEKFKAQGEREENEYESSFPTLRAKELGKKGPVLGDKPVFVIGGMRSRDWRRLYKLGVEKGNGTEEQRRCAKEMIDTADEKSRELMKGHWEMSEKGTLVFTKDSGHFVQLTQPDLVARGVNWVMDELKAVS